MELWRRLKRKLLARPEQTVCEGEANMTYAALAGCAEALAVRLTPFRCCAILCGSEDEDCLPLARHLHAAAAQAGLDETLHIQKGTRHQFPAKPYALADLL